MVNSFNGFIDLESTANSPRHSSGSPASAACCKQSTLNLHEAGRSALSRTGACDDSNGLSHTSNSVSSTLWNNGEIGLAK